MDTELARTFLNVVATGSFSAASERLFVTQSTVSARISQLERLLNCRLFVRNKGGAELTACGRHFQQHASVLVRTVEQARQDVGVMPGHQDKFVLGGRFGLWEQFLLGWLSRTRHELPQLSVRCEVGFEDGLTQWLVEGRLDVGVMYAPQSRPGMRVEQLFEERLLLVSSDASTDGAPGSCYVHVDWGPEFFQQYKMTYPERASSGIISSIGWIALNHVLTCGGSGYFPERLIAQELRDGRLHVVAGAPEFALPAYAVYPSAGRSEHGDEALEILRHEARRYA